MAIGRMNNPAGLASTASLVIVAALCSAAQAHDHHGVQKNIPEGETATKEPLVRTDPNARQRSDQLTVQQDSITWIHIFIQMLAYGVIFPIGMVFGMTKSRWHVPTQAVGSSLALLGFFLGHAHGGRQYVANNVHSVFANILQLLLVAQVVLGLYLKGHWERGINGRIRLLIRPFHSVIGKAMPLLAWVQMIFGGITTLGFCQGDHLGQCAAHFIMGGAFIAYGILLTIILLAGQVWMRRTGRSQEFFDSSVIAVWGCINTFTEHRWGTAWVKNDWQHTTMGIVWWCAGLAGIWLSRDRDGNPKRNFIPAFVIFITGWAMSAHPQELMVSAMTHAMFGKTLMAVGVTRVIEIAFVLKDKQSLHESGRTWNSFQYIPVFLMYAAGFLFMGATEEQMNLVDSSAMDGVSYTLILYSLAFMVFLFANMLIHLYDRLSPKEEGDKYSNGHIRLNGDAHEESRLRDVEEFELEGLSDEEDHDESRRMLNQADRSSSDTPSTLGRNNHTSAH